MWGLFRRRHKAPVAPLLVVEGNRFAAGARISGHAVLAPEIGDARVELRHVDLVGGTKVYDQPLTFRHLRAGLKHVEQTFVLDTGCSEHRDAFTSNESGSASEHCVHR